MAKLNAHEEEFMEKLRKADAYIPSDCELEIDYQYADPETCFKVDGWYAMKYDGSSASLLEEFSTKPIITNEEAEELGIDVEKCLDKYGCAYVGE